MCGLQCGSLIYKSWSMFKLTIFNFVLLQLSFNSDLYSDDMYSIMSFKMMILIRCCGCNYQYWLRYHVFPLLSILFWPVEIPWSYSLWELDVKVYWGINYQLINFSCHSITSSLYGEKHLVVVGWAEYYRMIGHYGCRSWNRICGVIGTLAMIPHLCSTGRISLKLYQDQQNLKIDLTLIQNLTKITIRISGIRV